MFVSVGDRDIVAAKDDAIAHAEENEGCEEQHQAGQEIPLLARTFQGEQNDEGDAPDDGSNKLPVKLIVIPQTVGPVAVYEVEFRSAGIFGVAGRRGAARRAATAAAAASSWSHGELDRRLMGMLRGKARREFVTVEDFQGSERRKLSKYLRCSCTAAALVNRKVGS